MTTKHDVEVALADYKELVSIEQHGNLIIVRLKQYLRDKTKWEAINDILRLDYKGEYISKAKGGPEWQVTTGSAIEKPEISGVEKRKPELEKGNNGTTSIFYCPYCGKRCQQVITKEAS